MPDPGALATWQRPATHQSEHYTQDIYGHVFGEQMGPGMSIDKA